MAERFNITRKEQEEFAVESHRRAIAAIEAGYFKEEIVPVTVKEKKKEFVFDTDESPRPTTTMEVLAKLKPLNKRNDGSEGTVTAGTSCGINDGAAAVVLMSEDKVKETGLKPMARIIDITVAALDPTIMAMVLTTPPRRSWSATT